MPSKVGGFDSRPVQVGTDRPVKRTSDSGSSSAQGTDLTATGSVRITDSARQLAALEQALKDLPAVNEARVAEIRTAIEEGSYEVHAERIADKLLSLEQELRGTATDE